MVTPARVTAPVFVEFLRRLIHNQDRPMFLIVDNHSCHGAHLLKDFVAETSGRLRVFYGPSYSPELTPDEWVRRHVKHHRMGHQVLAALHRRQKLPSVIRSFFYDPDIRYAL